MNDEGGGFQAGEGICRLTDERTDNCDCRVAFATEKSIYITEIRVDMYFGSYEVKQWISNQYKDDRIMNI